MKKILLSMAAVLCFSCMAQAAQIAEWRLDGDLTDSVGSYDAARVNTPSYTTGYLGQALDYSGGVTPDADNVLAVPYDPNLNTADFSASAWAKVTDASDYRAVVSAVDAGSPVGGYIIYAGPHPWGSPGEVWQLWLYSDTGAWTIPGPPVTYDTWTHVAVSYNSAIRQAVFCVDGYNYYYADLAGANSSYVPNDDKDFRIGCSANSVPAGGYYMDGLIDNVRLWNNALTIIELQQVYRIDYGDVVITTQPESATVVAGDTVTFTVAAENEDGYQWYKDGSPLSGQTSDTLVISNVQLADEGQYYCEVSNTGMTVTSDYALLLTRRQMAEWRLDGDLTDSVGTYDASRVNDPNYLTGIIGQSLDYTVGVAADPNNVIEVPYDPFLNSKDFTVSAWVKLDLGGAYTYRAVVSQRDQYTPASGYIVYASAGDHWEVWLATDGGWYIVDAGPIYFYDQWINVAVAFDSATKDVRVSIDGALHYDNIGSLSYIPAYSKGLRIGCGENENASGAFYMNGEIDHIQLWDYALDPYDIAQMYADISGQSVCVEAVEYDITGDCVVNLEDFARIASHWLDSNIVTPSAP